MPEATPRPTQVTIAAWMVMAGSVVVVLTAFDRIAGLRSADTREAVQEFRGTAVGEWLGLDLQGTLSLMRVLTMVAAACATAAAILGFQVLRRSRSARLVLTVLAAPLFVTGISVGGFLPAVVVGSITMLWFQPARDWVDGKTPRPVRPAPEPPAAADAPPQAPPATPDHWSAGSGAGAPPQAPRPYAGFGSGLPVAGPELPVTPVPTAYAGLPPSRARPRRPPALVWACALTWAGGALVTTIMVMGVAVVLAAPEMLLDELYRQDPDLRSEGFTPTTVRGTIVVTGALLVTWSVAAATFAAFAWRGRSWGWTALLVSACGAAALCLVAAVTSPLLLPGLALCGPAIPLLLRPEVRSFVAAR